MAAKINFDILISTTLRDTGGNAMNVCSIVDVNGTYPLGGMEVKPEDVGLQTISALMIQPLFAAPADTDFANPYDKAVDLVPQKRIMPDGSEKWCIVAFLYAMGGDEVPDGTPLVFATELPVQLIAIGKKNPTRRPG